MPKQYLATIDTFSGGLPDCNYISTMYVHDVVTYSGKGAQESTCRAMPNQEKPSSLISVLSIQKDYYHKKHIVRRVM